MNWRFVFSGLQSPLWTVSVVIAVVLAIVMFVLLRRYEAKLVPPAIGRTLLMLRVAVLVVLLVTFLQPVLTRSWQENQQHRVLIGVDLSESMDTIDRHAAPAEMLRWAQALGMLGNNSTAELLQQWIDAYENGREPDWAPGQPELAAIRKRQIQEVFDEFAGMTRAEFVRRLLQAKPTDLLGKLNQQLQTQLYVFGGNVQPADAEQLTELVHSDRRHLNPSATNAAALLSESLRDEQNGQLRAIVLFSDGRQTVSADTAAEASRLASLKIPVYCVPIGSLLSPRDLSIASLQAPQSVFIEDRATVQAVISASGFAGDQITVSLRQEDRLIDQQTVAVADDSFEVEFEIPTAEAGHFDYVIATDVQPGELREDNNRRDFTISVVDNQAKVLLVEGDARWEFRYLYSALDRDKRVDVSAVLFRQPYLQLLNRTFIDSSLPAEPELSETLAKTDLLLIGDVDPENLNAEFWQAVEKAVAEEGLTLLIMPGKQHMPHRFQSDILNRLLPVSNAQSRLAERFRPSQADRPPTEFRLHPTLAADELTLFDFSSGDKDGSEMTLSRLPGHPWICTGDPRPIATVWATAAIDDTDLNPDDFATIVHQYYGFGQVVWFGVDSTWRWRRRAGDKWHHQFWGQVVRWAARNKSAAGNDQVRLTLSDVIVEESDAVDVAVRWNPTLAPQLADATVEVVIENTTAGQQDAADAQRRLRLDPGPDSPERYSGRLADLKPGTYTVRLDVSGTPLKLDSPVESELIVQKKLSTELANVSCNREFLSQISAVSGGRLLEPWQIAELPELLAPESTTASYLQEKTLWDHWAILLLFFALLTAEWVLRKVYGLP